ncbi:MAG: hypothetical protein WC341_05860 [Bacteroidales bacterium]|jgi:hypothetical protein
MRRFLLIIIVTTICGWACKKEAPEIPECEKNETGQIQVFNGLNGNFKLYVDNTYFMEIKAMETQTVTYSKGICTVKLVLIEGDYWYQVATVHQCDVTNVSFRNSKQAVFKSGE